MNEKPKGLYVGFYMNEDNGHCKSHSKGLTEEQVEELKKLKVGDRLILFKSDRENTADYALKRYNPPKRDSDGGL